MTTPIDEVERWSPFKVWLFSLFNRTPKSNRAVLEHASLTSGDRVLDVGCGLGAALEHAVALGAEAAGVDPSVAMVERASRRVPQAKVEVGSAESIPFPDHRFTVVVNISSYHHWADSEAGLAETLRVLAPGGRLVIAEHKLKRDDGHGLSLDEAHSLADSLTRQGYASADVDTIEVGRKKYVVVDGVAPSD